MLLCKMLRGACDARAYAGRNDLLPEACTWHGEEVAILHAINQTTPDDLVRKKTSDPHNKADGIPQWNKPEPLPCSGIMQTPPSGRPRQAEAEQEVRKKMPNGDSRPSRSSGHHRCKYCPRQPMGQDQPAVSGCTHIFQSNGPPQFMSKKLPDRLLWKYHADGLLHQL